MSMSDRSLDVLLDPLRDLDLPTILARIADRSEPYCPSGQPLSVNTYFMRHGISVFSGGISLKLGTNIHTVSGHC